MADLGSIAESGLLTEESDLSEAWFLSGAEKGLLDYSTNQSLPWYFTAAEKGLLTYSRDAQGPINIVNGAEKGLLTYGSTIPILEANFSGSTTMTADLEVRPPVTCPAVCAAGPASCAQWISDDYGNITPPITSGSIEYWNNGNPIPAGTYIVKYVNGAFDYAFGSHTFNVNNILATGYYLVYSNGSSVDYFPATNYAFYNQAACEAANAGREITITHLGGRIGMYLQDNPYSDNAHGSPDPTFHLIQ